MWLFCILPIVKIFALGPIFAFLVIFYVDPAHIHPSGCPGSDVRTKTNVCKLGMLTCRCFAFSTICVLLNWALFRAGSTKLYTGKNTGNIWDDKIQKY